MSFAALPPNIRKALARRELQRRGSPTDAADKKFEGALHQLIGAYRALIPDMDERSELAGRISSGATTTADLAVLTALPADALAVLDMSPTKLITWLQSIEDRY